MKIINTGLFYLIEKIVLQSMMEWSTKMQYFNESGGGGAAALLA